MSNRDRLGRAFVFGLAGFMVSMILVVVPYFSRIGAFEPIPYRVTKTEWRVVDDHLIAKVTFWKDQCVFQKLIARGIYFDEVDPRLLPVVSLDDEQGDRMKGLETVRLKIGPIKNDYESIEIRTRHLCGDKFVDRIFLRADIHG